MSILKEISPAAYLFYKVQHLKNKKNFSDLRSGTGKYSLVGFDTYKCIFVHIPKTAGVSVNTSLFGNLGGGHKSIHAYKRIFGPLTFQRYFKFTIVRNPYSRLLSAYLFLKKGGFTVDDREWAKKNISMYSSFNDFVSGWINKDSIHSYIHFKPQFCFVCDQNFVPEVDFIGKIEHIDTDFKYICNRLGIERSLLRLNALDPPVDWRTFYNDASIEKVSDIYSRDFEMFNYPKGFEIPQHSFSISNQQGSPGRQSNPFQR